MTSKTKEKDAVSSSEKRVNIGLSEKVHAQAKIISTIKKIPLNKFLEQAIEEAVKKDKHLLEDLLK